MKFFRNPCFLIGIAVILAGVGLIVTSLLLFRDSPKEISRAELEQLIANKGLIDGRVAPTPYTGVYQVEGKRKVGTGIRKAGTQTERIFISTHLDEAQIKSLLEPTSTKMEMPGQSMRGQWISIISTL